MVDIVDAATRSRMMAAVRGANTKPELAVRRALHALGFRFRLHVKNLPGRPDLVFPKYRVAVFVHGCFWHRHKNCRFTTTPASNREFWEKKFLENTDRDARKRRELRQLGWRVLTIWECQATSSSAIARLARKIRAG